VIYLYSNFRCRDRCIACGFFTTNSETRKKLKTMQISI